MPKKDETPSGGGGGNGNEEFVLKWKMDTFSKEYFLDLIRTSKSLFFLRGNDMAKDSEYRITRTGDILEIISDESIPELIACYGKTTKPIENEVVALEGIYNLIKELLK